MVKPTEPRQSQGRAKAEPRQSQQKKRFRGKSEMSMKIKLTKF
jgi:hypothetical protein